ncbi:MAG: RHS repeat-associated core domain-containing protein, partial [Candidatus Binatia bacterium]
MKKTLNGQNTEYLSDGVNPLQEQAVAGGPWTALMMLGLGVDEVLARADSSGVHYFLPDALGSTVSLTDSFGVTEAEYSYTPFGETTRTGTVTTNPLQFTGREHDNTGLYYYRARYYHPVLQRFISEDPIGFRGGDVNLYGYVSNNPVNFIDPDGEQLVMPVPPGTIPEECLRSSSPSTAGRYDEADVPNTTVMDRIEQFFSDVLREFKCSPAFEIAPGPLGM